MRSALTSLIVLLGVAELVISLMNLLLGYGDYALRVSTLSLIPAASRPALHLVGAVALIISAASQGRPPPERAPSGVRATVAWVARLLIVVPHGPLSDGVWAGWAAWLALDPLLRAQTSGEGTPRSIAELATVSALSITAAVAGVADTALLTALGATFAVPFGIMALGALGLSWLSELTRYGGAAALERAVPILGRAAVWSALLFTVWVWWGAGSLVDLEGVREVAGALTGVERRLGATMTAAAVVLVGLRSTPGR